MLNDPYFSGTKRIKFSFAVNKIYQHIKCTAFFLTDGMMMTTQHTESSGMMTRQITKEVVQRSVMGGTTVTKKMFYES